MPCRKFFAGDNARSYESQFIPRARDAFFGYSTSMIGLFDSGSGGLSVLTALRRRAPRADICYFGDIVHAPYGERDAEELATLTRHGIARLVDAGASEIVSACNSVSLSVLMGAAGDNPVIEMTRPTAHALRAHAGKRMLLIATPATIRSRIYKDAIGVTISLDELPISGLAGAIEFNTPTDEIQRIVHEAFISKKEKEYDGLILGCTHYPLIRSVIEQESAEIFGPLVIIDPAEAVAEEIIRRFDVRGDGLMQFLLSQDSQVFRNRVAELFPASSYTIDIV